MSQETLETTQETQVTQESEHETGSRIPTEVYADDFTEEQIGALFNKEKDNEDSEELNHNLDSEEEKADQNVKQETSQENEKPKEESTEEKKPITYEVEIFDNQRVELSENELQQVVEMGAMYAKNKGVIEQSLALGKAIQEDSQLQQILHAYVNKQELPQFHVKPKVEQPKRNFSEQEEQIFSILKQEVLNDLLPVFLQQTQQHYKPFVDNVNKFASDYKERQRQKEVQKEIDKQFSVYKKDPSYEEVNKLMDYNINLKLIEGKITHSQASEIEQELKRDPQLYGHWFNEFKKALKNKPGQTKEKVKAPHLKAPNGNNGSETVENWAKTLKKAIGSDDPTSIGALLN